MESTNKITFLGQKKLPITDLSLVFRVQSIYEKFGTLNDFANQYNVEGITNGELFIIPQNKGKIDNLTLLFDNNLGSKKFKVQKDVTILLGHGIEDLLKRKSSLMNCKIPDCRGIDWLGSEITEEGFFIWENPLDTYGCLVIWGTNAYDDKIMAYYLERLLKYFSETDPDKLTLNPMIDELRKCLNWYRKANHELTMPITEEKLLEIKNWITKIIY